MTGAKAMCDARRDWLGEISGRLRAIVWKRVAAQVDRRPDEWDAISDLTHDAFLAAAERLGDFRGTTEAELVAWVSAIAENKLCDHRRAVRRKRRDVRRTCSLEVMGDVLVDDETPPTATAILNEERQWVLKLVARLPWRYRTAIRLRYLEGASIAVVATHLCCSEAAAQGVLKRALVWLRRAAQLSEPGSSTAIEGSGEP